MSFICILVLFVYETYMPIYINCMLHNQMTKRQYWLDYKVLKSTQHHKSQQAEADQKKTIVKSHFMKGLESVCAFAMVIS